MNVLDPTWKVEIWAEDEDCRLRRDDRARERVKVMYVQATDAKQARKFALRDQEVCQRWPRANAAAFRVAG